MVLAANYRSGASFAAVFISLISQLEIRLKFSPALPVRYVAG